MSMKPWIESYDKFVVVKLEAGGIAPIALYLSIVRAGQTEKHEWTSDPKRAELFISAGRAVHSAKLHGGLAVAALQFEEVL